MSITSRFLGLGVVFGLVAGLLVGVVLTQPGRAAAHTPSAAPHIAPNGGPAVAPVTTTVPSGGTNSTTAASSGPAIAYPYFAGTPGLAPDHTIVVTGVGQANMQSDGSDRAAARNTAIAAALADAKAQADAIASDTGLTINGVLSVAASVSPSYGVLPPVPYGSGTSACVPPAMGEPSASGEPVAPQASGMTAVPQPACVPVYRQTVGASVTVEYHIG